MLAIRMQRTGRKGHAQFRIVVQDSHVHPSSGKVIDFVGSYDPHTKVVKINKEKAELFMKNGAQPSDRVVSLFTREKIKMPAWVSVPAAKEGTTKNPQKLRKNQPEKPATEQEAEAESLSEPALEAASEEASQPEAPEQAAEAAVEEPVAAEPETDPVPAVATKDDDKEAEGAKSPTKS